MTTEITGRDPLEVCTLPPSDLESRLEWVRREILPHAVGRERLPDGVAWELRDAPGLGTRLDRLIELEADCCASLSFTQQPGSASGTRRLEIRGVDPDASILQGAFLAQPGNPGIGRRLGRAAGLGTALSLFVCCVLPIGAAALLGATAAAPLASLDQPWIIAGSGLLFGSAVFAWQSRKRPEQAASKDPCGC